MRILRYVESVLEPIPIPRGFVTQTTILTCCNRLVGSVQESGLPWGRGKARRVPMSLLRSKSPREAYLPEWSLASNSLPTCPGTPPSHFSPSSLHLTQTPVLADKGQYNSPVALFPQWHAESSTCLCQINSLDMAQECLMALESAGWECLKQKQMVVGCLFQFRFPHKSCKVCATARFLKFCNWLSIKMLQFILQSLCPLHFQEVHRQ